MIGEREREITIQEYSKVNDKNVRQVQEEDPELNALYKALNVMQNNIKQNDKFVCESEKENGGRCKNQCPHCYGKYNL